MNFWELEQSVWQRLVAERRPIALYGMGDGADKILAQLARFGVQVAAVFASDGFVRGQSFHGCAVQTLSQVTAQWGRDIVLVVAFGSKRPEVLQQLYALDHAYELVAPDVPVVAGEIFDEAFAEAHQDDMARAYELLEDESSRAVFLDTVRYKLSGKLRYLRASESPKEEAFENILRPTRSEHFADLGAYTGDTIRELLSYTNGQFASITALEPDRRSFRKLAAYAESLTGQVELVPAGAWSGDEERAFSDQAGRQSRVTDSGKTVQMRALDSVLNGKECTLLKLDVEGAERQALWGAANTIQRHRPRLNLAAYHTSADFFELLLLVRELCPAYRLYLRHHPHVPAWDTNIYASYP